MIELNDDELRAAYYCASAEIRRRQRGIQPIPDWLRSHYLQLHSAAARSRAGTKIDTASSELKPEWIGAGEVARMIGRTRRSVTAHARDFDGELVAGRWLFPRNLIDERLHGSAP